MNRLTKIREKYLAEPREYWSAAAADVNKALEQIDLWMQQQEKRIAELQDNEGRKY